MASEEHLKILKQGVEAWNKWREEQDIDMKPDLFGANLSRAKLIGANFTDTNLTAANLREADLSRAE